jgi:DNA gyrase/topoisomerase IV subunit B
MDPKTRRIYQVTMDDINRTKEQMGILIGKNKDEVAKRKELLLDFKFTTADIDT